MNYQGYNFFFSNHNISLHGFQCEMNLLVHPLSSDRSSQSKCSSHLMLYEKHFSTPNCLHFICPLGQLIARNKNILATLSFILRYGRVHHLGQWTQVVVESNLFSSKITHVLMKVMRLVLHQCNSIRQIHQDNQFYRHKTIAQGHTFCRRIVCGWRDIEELEKDKKRKKYLYLHQKW